MRRICFTGHRDIKSKDIAYVKDSLRNMIREEIEKGASHFMCGLAKGADSYAAEIVWDEKKNFPHIILEGAAPYRGRLNSRDAEIRRIVGLCDEVFVVLEKSGIGCYQKRNEFMVDNSQSVIAVYDDRGKGGTYNTIEYAKKKGKEVRIINLEG